MDAIVVLILVELSVLAGVLAIVLGDGFGAQSVRRQLEAFAARLDAGRVERPRGLLAALRGGPTGRVEGRLAGRQVKLELVGVNGVLRYGVAIAHDPRPQTLTRDELLAQLERRAEGAQAEAARAALAHLFGVLGFRAVTLAEGWLGVERLFFNYALSEASLQRVFGALLRIAPLYETRRVALAPGLEVRCWTAGGEGLHCPYCRDALDPRAAEGPAGAEEGAPRACEACRTLHHAACFAELGGCAVFACAGGARGAGGARPLQEALA